MKNKTIIKRITVFTIVLVMLLSSVPGFSYAEETMLYTDNSNAEESTIYSGVSSEDSLLNEGVDSEDNNDIKEKVSKDGDQPEIPSDEFSLITGEYIQIVSNEEEIQSARTEEDEYAAGGTLISEIEGLKEYLEENEIAYDGYIVEIEEPALRENDLDSLHIEEAGFADDIVVVQEPEKLLDVFSAEDIVRIEPNYIITLDETEEETENKTAANDPYYTNGSQWNLDLMNVPYIWEKGYGSKSVDGDPVIVAIIDTGINTLHEDIDPEHVLPGFNWSDDVDGTEMVEGDTADVEDWNGHGTHCAGQIIATRNNQLGIAGIVPEAYIMPLKIFGEKNTSVVKACRAIYYAIENGADVINMSFGQEKIVSILEDACKEAVDNGVIVVASAGNGGKTVDPDTGEYVPNYPAAFDFVCGTGSIGTSSNHETISTFSQWGRDNVFCVSPGYAVSGTYINSESSYSKKNGTSFAAPSAAALAALAKSIDRNIDQERFQDLIADTCKDMGDEGRDDAYGYGLLDYEAFIEKLIVHVEDVKLSESSHALDKGTTCKLSAELIPSDSTFTGVTWSSSDESVATVNQNGNIAGIADGTAVITVTTEDGGKTASCSVKVTTRVKSVTLSQTKAKISIGDKLSLTATILPTDAANKKITWSSSDVKVAEVMGVKWITNDEGANTKDAPYWTQLSGNAGIVTGLNYGKTIISATAEDNGIKATCELQVLFRDVTDSSEYYYKPVYWAADNNITKGYMKESDKATGKYGKFGHDLSCTRADVVTFLWRLAGCPEPKTKKNPFKDIKQSAYYYKAVLWAVENGITKGYTTGVYKGQFRPNDTCLREHVVTFLWRYAGKPAPKTKKNPFGDIRISDYYYNAVLWSYEKGIAYGYSSGKYKGGFGPKLECLREHVVTFLWRYKGKPQ